MSPRNSYSFDEDIVERRVGDPLATALLVMGAFCLAGAITFQVWEIFQYRVEGEDTVLPPVASRFHNDLKLETQKICNEVDSLAKKGKETLPTKGGEESAFLGSDIEQIVRELLDEYGYGKRVLDPVLREDGVVGKKAAGAAPAAPGEKAEEPGLDIEELDALSGEESSAGKEKAEPAGTEGDLDLDALGEETTPEKDAGKADSSGKKSDEEIDLNVDLEELK